MFRSGLWSPLHPPEYSNSAPNGTDGSSGSSSQRSGSTTRPGDPCRPRGPSASAGNSCSWSRVASSSSSSSRLSTSPSLRRVSEPDRETLEVPGDVLADVADALVRAHVVAQQFGVAAQRHGDLARASGGVGRRAAGERGREVAEQPRPAQAAAPDDDAVASGLGDHRQRVRRADQMSPLPSTGSSAGSASLAAGRSRTSRPCPSSAVPPSARAGRRPRPPRRRRSGRRRGR